MNKKIKRIVLQLFAQFKKSIPLQTYFVEEYIHLFNI